VKEQRRDKNIVKESIGDPAFYNDQISKSKEPVKKEMDKKKGGSCKSGL